MRLDLDALTTDLLSAGINAARCGHFGNIVHVYSPYRFAGMPTLTVDEEGGIDIHPAYTRLNDVALKSIAIAERHRVAAREAAPAQEAAA